MTVSNIVAPLLLYLGRFAIAAMVSVEAVAYFSVPYDVVINLLIIPGVFVSALFPAFAQQFVTKSVVVKALYLHAQGYMFLIMLPLAAVTYLAAKVGLAWWLNPEFASSSYQVAQLLAIGIFVNSFGHISQSLIQAYGRPDITAKLHVAELVLYMPYLWWLTLKYGINGAAFAWVVRVAISSIALWLLADRCLAGKLHKKF